MATGTVTAYFTRVNNKGEENNGILDALIRHPAWYETPTVTVNPNREPLKLAGARGAAGNTR